MTTHGRQPEETTLTVWQVVELVHANRPYSLDYIRRLLPTSSNPATGSPQTIRRWSPVSVPSTGLQMFSAIKRTEPEGKGGQELGMMHPRATARRCASRTTPASSVSRSSR